MCVGGQLRTLSYPLHIHAQAWPCLRTGPPCLCCFSGGGGWGGHGQVHRGSDKGAVFPGQRWSMEVKDTSLLPLCFSYVQLPRSLFCGPHGSGPQKRRQHRIPVVRPGCADTRRGCTLGTATWAVAPSHIKPRPNGLPSKAQYHHEQRQVLDVWSLSSQQPMGSYSGVALQSGTQNSWSPNDGIWSVVLRQGRTCVTKERELP